MTNSERADRLLSEAALVAQEMRSALQSRSWNLGARRAQEVLELVVKALLNEMGVESPRVHDPAPALADALRARRLDVEPTLLEWLTGLSARLAQIRAPAFYQEIAVSEEEAGAAVEGAERVLAFGRDLLARLRR